MATYAIDDIQGCYKQLRLLLKKIAFNEHDDRLWLVGDLVNRGPDSLSVLRYLSELAHLPIVTLGNHDLHLLAVYHGAVPINKKDTFQDVLEAHDVDSLCHWLQSQKLIHYDKALNFSMMHAGLSPVWTFQQALQYAAEVENVLKNNERAKDLFAHMYGNQPDIWHDELKGYDRYRLIINYCTRMRYCYTNKKLNLIFKDKIEHAPDDLIPWFEVLGDTEYPPLVFGHWASLEGKVNKPNLFALDTGCVWGGSLTAMRLEDKKRFSV